MVHVIIFAISLSICYTERMKTICVTIAKNWEGRTVGELLKTEFAVSRTLLSKLKRRQDGILLNDRPVYVTHRVSCGDTLTAAVGDDRRMDIPPRPYPLSIRYEDPDYLVLSKPCGMAVHPTRDPDELTLEHALLAYLPESENPHPISRLDKGTTGLMLVAKSGYAHTQMKKQMERGLVRKEYLAIASGCPSPSEGSIHLPIAPLPGSTYQRTVSPDGQKSSSRYRVLATRGELSLLHLIPETGRTHQLRVHLSHIGHPLLGDWLYGTRHPQYPHALLHAYRLRFVHPFTDECITLEAPLPDAMRTLFPDAPLP